MNKTGVIGDLHTHGFHANRCFSSDCRIYSLKYFKPSFTVWFLTVKPDTGQKKKRRHFFSPFLSHLTKVNFNLNWSQFSSVQFISVAQLCPTLCDPMNRSTPGLPVITNSQSSLRLTSIESVMPSSHLTCFPLLLLPPIPPSIRVFPMSQLFAGGGQSIGVSALASVLPKNTQD